MVEESIFKEETIKRINTGIEGLDNLIEGGFPEKSITLVSGPPGGGKSIFCFQFLFEGIKNDEKGLFLTLDKGVEGIIKQAKKLGYDFQSAMENKLVKFQYLNIGKKFVYESMTNEILSGDYQRIVLDSITPLSEMPIYLSDIEKSSDFSIINSEESINSPNIPIRRLHLRYIFDALESSESTSVVTSELPNNSTMLSRDGISEFLSDGVITLNLDPTMNRRKLSIMKMRNTKHTLKPQEIQISSNGMKIMQ